MSMKEPVQINLETHKMLTLSTAHVSRKTATWLDTERSIVAYQKSEYGWFIPITEDTIETPDIPNDLKKVLEFGAQHECTWVMFDSDGPVVTGLPEFDW